MSLEINGFSIFDHSCGIVFCFIHVHPSADNVNYTTCAFQRQLSFSLLFVFWKQVVYLAHSPNGMLVLKCRSTPCCHDMYQF